MAIMSLDYLRNDPLLQHPKLNARELAMICDVCNPGFKMQRELDGANREILAAHTRANIEDSFRLHPGDYEEKWDVDRESFRRKLSEMTPQELAQVADQVDQFWEATEFTNDLPKRRVV
jgi:hypothetical protein